jgi:ribulose-phosphate 3-epimerase
LSLKRIRELGAKTSVAVNLDVTLEKVTGCFPNIDMILMMTVFPGFGGQAFIPDVLPKIEQVRKVIDQKKLPILVEADGGIKADNIDRVVRAGAQVIVSGSSIFWTPDYAQTIHRMRKAVGQL